jgi:cytosine/adenosine deaminase-related metal-dependent hydrolase
MADFIAIDLNRLEFAGAQQDPVAAVILCTPGAIDTSWVGGRPLVSDGRVVGVDQGALVTRHNRLAGDLAE